MHINAHFLRKFLFGPVPMIGVSGNDLLCSIELFDEHAADQHVWPGEAAKGNRHVHALAHRLVESVGSSDYDA